MELHKQQLEFQQFTLQKTKQQQKITWRITRKFIKWGRKLWKRHDIFPEYFYNPIDTFEYVPENDQTFEAFYWRYEDIFNLDCEQWPCKKRVNLLLRKLGKTEHNRFVDFILPKKTTDFDFSETIKVLSEQFGPNTTLLHKRWKCLNIVKVNQRRFSKVCSVGEQAL